MKNQLSNKSATGPVAKHGFTTLSGGMSGAVLVGALALGLAGCGSNNNAAVATPTPTPTPDLSQTVASVIDYITSLITGGSDTAEPVAVNDLTLATDDKAEPTPLP